MTTILIVEDNDAVAMGLLYALRKEGFAPIRAATAAEARRKVSAADLIILDIRLPDGSGFDLCRQFRADGLRQPIIMLTARDEVIDRVIGLEIGADDYLTKPYELRELIARVRAQLRRSYGELAMSDGPTRLQAGDLTIDLLSQQVMRGEREIHLTATEFRLLSFLAQHPNQPHSRQRLIEDIWGYDTFVGDIRTIDVHVRNIRQKIEADPSAPALLVTVRGAGYKLVTDPPVTAAS